MTTSKWYSSMQACFYDNGTEFCLNPNEYETSKQKIINYFGYDPNTWIQTGSSGSLTAPGDSTTRCSVSTTFINCNNSVVGVYAESSGYVDTSNVSPNLYCEVKPDGSAGCGGE